MIKKMTFLAFLFAFLISSSSWAQAPEALWSVTYHDGSGNGFHFWQGDKGGDTRFEYTPVQPESSSSGTYSGGAPKQGVMNPKQVKKLWSGLRPLEKDQSLQTTTRSMGTGAFAVKEENATREFIITNGPALKKFNESLTPFRGR